MNLSDSVDSLIRRQHQESKSEALHEDENRPNGSPGCLYNQPAIYSQLSFSCSFLTSFSATSISHLRSILHHAARVIFRKCLFDRVISLFKTLTFPVICTMSQSAPQGDHGSPSSLQPGPGLPLHSHLPVHFFSPSQPLYSAHVDVLTLFPKPGWFSLSLWLSLPLSPSACEAPVPSSRFTTSLHQPPQEALATSLSLAPLCPVTFVMLLITLLVYEFDSPDYARSFLRADIMSYRFLYSQSLEQGRAQIDMDYSIFILAVVWFT